jgi:hypothetical protein
MPRTVPVMLTEVPGNFITGALWNAQVGALGAFMLNVPFFTGYQVATQSLSHNTWTNITLDTEYFDDDGGHSTVTNTSRYVCQVAGRYELTGVAVTSFNTTGLRAAKLAKNGTTITGSAIFIQASPSVGTSVLTSIPVQLAVGDYVELHGWQGSGGALSTLSSADSASVLTAKWVRS